MTSSAGTSELPAWTRPTLVELAGDLLVTAIEVTRGNNTRDGDGLRRHVLELRQRFERGAREQAHSADDIADASRALIVFIDESVLTMDSSIRDRWGDKPLYAELYGDALGGEAFYMVLARLRQDVHRRIEALELYLVCMDLGFG